MKLTLEQFKELSPCEPALNFVVNECGGSIKTAWDKCERGDWMIWLARRKLDISKEQYVRIAIACAEPVLKIFEAKYPNDNRPRKAIEAAKAWLASPTEENKKAAAAAAYAADAAAAYAAYSAAAAAAYAAYAAADAYAYAAYAAASYAAYAAADASYAAYAAASSAAQLAQDAAARKEQSDIIRSIIPNPFEE